MLNKVILIGRMTRDPDQRGKDPEKPIASFRIAVDRDYKRDGEPEADFFDCSVFGQQAKFVLQYGRKGRLLCVVGAIQRREWQDQQTGCLLYTSPSPRDRSVSALRGWRDPAPRMAGPADRREALLV